MFAPVEARASPDCAMLLWRCMLVDCLLQVQAQDCRLCCQYQHLHCTATLMKVQIKVLRGLPSRRAVSQSAGRHKGAKERCSFAQKPSWHQSAGACHLLAELRAHVRLTPVACDLLTVVDQSAGFD